MSRKIAVFRVGGQLTNKPRAGTNRDNQLSENLALLQTAFYLSQKALHNNL